MVRERDFVGRRGLFVIEGRVVLERTVRACPGRLVSVMVAEGRLQRLAEVLTGLSPDILVDAASQAVMDQIVGFPIHRGILPLGLRDPLDPAWLPSSLPAKALVVGLSAIANHDNMGGIFRNAAAFGVNAVLLDSDCYDPLYRKAIRVSVGAAITTPFVQLPPGSDLAETLVAAVLAVLALTPRGEVDISALTPAPRTAVLFGAEGPDPPPALLVKTRTVRIAMAHGFGSLNVATTSGIVLHHLAGQLPSD